MASVNEKILRNPQSIGWWDLFSGFFSKHTQKDKDYALIAGTSLDTAVSESTMVQKWQRPWLWRNVLLSGILVATLIVGVILYIIATEGRCRYNALNLLLVVILPCVIPIALMIFFWEMNIPRNISLTKVLKYFIVGGVLALFSTTLLLHQFRYLRAWPILAPLTEEPAKLIVSLCFLYALKKSGKIYGLNGIVIGAAVGAGFAAFESAQYIYDVILRDSQMMNIKGVYIKNLIMNSDGFVIAMRISIIRALGEFSGHVLFCAPYVGMAALNISKGSNLLGALTKKNFIVAFVISCAVHAFNNSGCFFYLFYSLGRRLSAFEDIGLTYAVCTVVLWWSCLRTVRSSFEQITQQIPVHSATRSKFKIECVSGVHAGIAFAIVHDEILIGTDAECKLTFPISTFGIDPRHSKLLIRGGGLYLADLGSKYGTYLNYAKLKVGSGYLLNVGDVFWIGTEEQKFRVIECN